MTTLRLIVLVIVTIYGLTSCNPDYKKIFIENDDNFNLNRLKLNDVVIDIEITYLKDWDRKKDLIIQDEDLDKEARKTIEELGIGSIELKSNPNSDCEKNYWITLNVVDDWNIGALNLVQIVYAPCCKITEKEYHYSDGYHRDFWGQGGNWFIYSDNDFM